MRESRGTVVEDWETATAHEVPGCSFQPLAGSTSWAEAGQPSTLRAYLYAPPGADLRRGDRVGFMGASFRVEGVPMPWKSPFGRTSHVVCPLVDWEG
ncbi:hypothetical protein HLV35_07515 [Eggerthellaceae bacterium zg-997]|nr:hypothetical protein [Eggerthellaceae bacterium zg-997]